MQLILFCILFIFISFLAPYKLQNAYLHLGGFLIYKTVLASFFLWQLKESIPFSLRFYLTFPLNLGVVVFKVTATALGHFQLLYSYSEFPGIYVSWCLDIYLCVDTFII